MLQGMDATEPDHIYEMDDPDLPYHLQLDTPPLAVCGVCGRKSWSPDIGKPCNMPQPDGHRCGGLMLHA